MCLRHYHVTNLKRRFDCFNPSYHFVLKMREILFYELQGFVSLFLLS